MGTWMKSRGRSTSGLEGGAFQGPCSTLLVLHTAPGHAPWMGGGGGGPRGPPRLSSPHRPGGGGGGGGAPPPPRPPPPRSFSSESQRGWQYGVQRPAQGPHGMVCGAWSVVGSIGVSLPFYLHAMAERGCNSMFRASCRRSGADSATERNNGIP
jgi:hypothetical protein